MTTMKWMITILVILVFGAAPAAAQDGFVALFDGETLSGWEGAEGRWSVRDGALTGETTEANPLPSNTFIVWRAGEVDDFELRLSYRIVGGNSGIQYRSREVSPWVIAGYQADFEAGDTFSGILYDEKGRGILAERGQATRVLPGKKIEQRDPVGDSAALQAAIKKEDWNEYTILARGNRLIHKINGRVTVDVIDEDREQAERSGLLALQLHAGPPMTVQFKDIRIKRLPLAEGKKIVLVSGKPSHALGEHEFPAGVSALRHALDQLEGVIAADYYEGWPADPSAFDNADAIFFYMDGGARHPMIQGERLAQLDALMKRGVGMACAHYAVEVPADRGGAEFIRWIGGYYETDYSINPHWEADIASFPEHPITHGVGPFKLRDEWYYNMRFRDGMRGVTPILMATPPDATRRTDATRANPGREEILAWAVEREDGGRGFGFTGGHFHRNWGNHQFRRLVTNALLWVAKAEVPEGGVRTDLTDEQLNGKLREPARRRR